jgi:hypothetical protein
LAFGFNEKCTKNVLGIKKRQSFREDIKMRSEEVLRNQGLTVAIIIVVVLFVSSSIYFAGCQKSTPPPDKPAGIIANSSGCKAIGVSRAGQFSSSESDCVEYDYDEESGLVLRHINAGFNCCSAASANISVEGNLITVEETESGDLCHCLCLYDMEYRIEALPPGEYTIKFIELCLAEDDELLEFTVDFGSSPSGSHCLDRNHYPWVE